MNSSFSTEDFMKNAFCQTGFFKIHPVSFHDYFFQSVIGCFGAQWFGSLRSPYLRGILYLEATPGIQKDWDSNQIRT